MQKELDKLYAYEDSLKSIFDEIVLIPVLKTYTAKVKQIDTIKQLLEDLKAYVKTVNSTDWDNLLLNDVSYCLYQCEVLQNPLFKEDFKTKLSKLYEILHNRFSPISSMQDFANSLLNPLKKATK